MFIPTFLITLICVYS